jgi:hypothetical protein
MKKTNLLPRDTSSLSDPGAHGIPAASRRGAQGRVCLGDSVGEQGAGKQA